MSTAVSNAVTILAHLTNLLYLSVKILLANHFAISFADSKSNLTSNFSNALLCSFAFLAKAEFQMGTKGLVTHCLVIIVSSRSSARSSFLLSVRE